MLKKIFFAAGLIISAVCIYYVLKKADLSQLGHVAGSIRWGWMGACLLLLLAQIGLRALRWKYFYPDQVKVTGKRLFTPLMIGYALSSIFPGRVGEVSRALLVSRREKAAIPTAFATVVAERLIDGIMVMIGFIIVLLKFDFGNFSLRVSNDLTLNAARLHDAARILGFFIILPIFGGIVLIMSSHFRSLATRIVHALPFLPAAVKQFFEKILHSFALGFEALGQPVKLFWIAALSVLIWVLTVFNMQVMAPVLGLHMTFLGGMVITIVTGLSMLLPAVSGGWGLYEVSFLFATGMIALEGNPTQHTAMALLFHLVQFSTLVLLGFACAVASGISFWETAKVDEAALEAAGETEKQ